MNLSNARVISGDDWLQIELKEYQKMIASPYHKERYSNFYYMRRANYLKKRIETAINNGEIVYETNK